MDLQKVQHMDILTIRSITNVSIAVHFLIVIQVSVKAYGPLGELCVSL